MRSKFGLNIKLTGVNSEDHTFATGLAGGSLNGSLVTRNGTLYANDSTERDFYEFGNTCELPECIEQLGVF